MKTLVRNIGQFVSGDIRRPLLDADSLPSGRGREGPGAGRCRPLRPPCVTALAFRPAPPRNLWL